MKLLSFAIIFTQQGKYNTPNDSKVYYYRRDLSFHEKQLPTNEMTKKLLKNQVSEKHLCLEIILLI